MPEFDWPAIDATYEQRRKAKLAQQWADEVLAVPPERRIMLGKLDVWRYQFYRKDTVVSLPLYEHPDTGGYVAILPEDWGEPREWGVAFMTPLSEFPGRGMR